MSKPEAYKNINSFSLIPIINNKNLEYDKIRSINAETKRIEAKKWNDEYLILHKFIRL